MKERISIPPNEQDRMIDKHRRICYEAGLPVPRTEDVHFSLTYGTPFKQKIQIKVLHIYQELFSFINQQNEINIRQFMYHLLQSNKPEFQSFDVSTTAKADAFYAKIQHHVNRCRLAGLIPFDSITDSTSLYGTDQYDMSLSEYLQMQSLNYRSDWFKYQDCYVEIWIEKEGLVRTISQVTDNLGVYLSCAGGRTTWSQVNSAIERFKKIGKEKNYILYFGDFDPIGKDIPRWLREEAFRTLNFPNVEIIEVALNRSDIRVYALKELPLKKPKNLKNLVDWFIDNYNDKGVELDALSPNVLRQKVRDAILSYLNINEIERCRGSDQQEIQKISQILQV